jgi:DNA-binding HxlR family transcriptional regulator
MQRKSLAKASCPVARTLDVIGDWWTLLIVRDALRGARRFSDFERSLGVAKNILTTRLRKLQADGILETVASSDGGPYREYVLTAKGKALRPVVRALWKWGEAHLYTSSERPVRKVRFE